LYIRRRSPRSVNDSMHGKKHGNKHGKAHDQHTNLHSNSLRPRILHLLSIATGPSPKNRERPQGRCSPRTSGFRPFAYLDPRWGWISPSILAWFRLSDVSYQAGWHCCIDAVNSFSSSYFLCATWLSRIVHIMWLSSIFLEFLEFLTSANKSPTVYPWEERGK
jgi:hypothetical protein